MEKAGGREEKDGRGREGCWAGPLGRERGGEGAGTREVSVSDCVGEGDGRTVWMVWGSVEAARFCGREGGSGFWEGGEEMFGVMEKLLPRLTAVIG